MIEPNKSIRRGSEPDEGSTDEHIWGQFMSLIPADGVYRRRLFRSGRQTSRRMTAIGLAAALTCVGVILLPGMPTIPLPGLSMASSAAGTAPPDSMSGPSQALAAAPSEQPASPQPTREPEPSGQVATLALSNGAANLAVAAAPPEQAATTPAAAPAPEPAAVVASDAIGGTASLETATAASDEPSPSRPVAMAPNPAGAAATSIAADGAATFAMNEPPPAPAADAVTPTAPPEVTSSSPPMPSARVHKHQPQVFLELSYYSDPAGARRGELKVRRQWKHVLAGLPVRIMPAEAQGAPIWRVVAGPVVGRDRGTKICAAVKRTGRNCAVAVM